MALYLLYRGIRQRAYFAGIGERLGFLRRLGFPTRLASFRTTGSGAIWFHAVSVGEVLSAVELIRRLCSERQGISIFVSTTTLAGRALAEQRLEGLAQGVFFAPLDYRSVVRRVLRRLRPAAVVILETEIWPNLYRESKRAGASLLIVNGRISDRALPRYRSANGFFRHALIWPDAIFTQSEEDARRFVIAGAPPERVSCAGNLKYDFTPPASGIPPDIVSFLDRQGPDGLWIAASTMPPASGINATADPDEDDAVIAAFASMNRPGLLLILAPRRPERFDIAAEKLFRAGIPFARRTEIADAGGNARVLLLDSIGELAALFELADVVFMGGTLASRGGHNILEPAYFSKPVIAGPHMENFTAIADEFSAHNALLRIAGPEQLASAVTSLLDHPETARSIGANARKLALSKRGAVERIASEILAYAALGVPNPPRTLAARVVLTPLSWIWRCGAGLRPALFKPLNTKVVSVGALVMGGAGKSPIVAHLAERLHAAGRNPAILTRGYRRKSSGIVIVPRGESASILQTGDEAQTFVRAGCAHVGIGADRFEVGRQMEGGAGLRPAIFLLDDGFQHVRLKRDEDIVLIDALDPLAGGVFPLGRLREPFKNVARATVIIVTRVEPGQNIAGIEQLIRRHNQTAPIFRSRVVPREWVRFEGGPSPFTRVGAFCGLGSPNSFWRTLQRLGVEVAFRRAFSDHHPYSPSQLRRLAAQATAEGVEALVTTEKDIMNLCEGASALLAPHPLYWLKIGVEIEGEEELLGLLR